MRANFERNRSKPMTETRRSQPRNATHTPSLSPTPGAHKTLHQPAPQDSEGVYWGRAIRATERFTPCTRSPGYTWRCPTPAVPRLHVGLPHAQPPTPPLDQKHGCIRLRGSRQTSGGQWQQQQPQPGLNTRAPRPSRSRMPETGGADAIGCTTSNPAAARASLQHSHHCVSVSSG